MARHTFAYIPFVFQPTAPFPSGQTVFRPYLGARLIAPNGNTFRCVVWPDSGADHCAFPLSFAIAMRIDPLQMRYHLTGGVGSTGNVTFYSDLTIEVGALGDPSADLTPIASFTSYVGFTSGLEAQGLGLLGQSGFFEKHVVVFDHPAKQFHIDTI